MLSKESEQFLNNLRAYLMTRGKKETAVLEIVDDLRNHLLEAEQDGKSVESIIGQSPEAYMKSIGQEMRTDMMPFLGRIILTVTSALVFYILILYDKGVITVSSFEIIAISAVYVFGILLIVLFGYFASAKNKSMTFSVSFIVGFFLLQFILVTMIIFGADHVTSTVITIEGVAAQWVRIGAVIIIVLSAIAIKYPIFIILSIMIGPTSLIELVKPIANDTLDYLALAILIVGLIISSILWYKDVKEKRKYEKRNDAYVIKRK